MAGDIAGCTDDDKDLAESDGECVKGNLSSLKRCGDRDGEEGDIVEDGGGRTKSRDAVRPLDIDDCRPGPSSRLHRRECPWGIDEGCEEAIDDEGE